MTSIINKIGFYSSLYLDYAGVRSGTFTEPSDAPIANVTAFKRDLRVHFWTPSRTPGAAVAVYDVLPSLKSLVKDVGLNWTISADEVPPRDKCDWLICFKAVPKPGERARHRRTAMLICDQAEVFWGSLRTFDLQVATSSRAFASVVAQANKNTSFIGESEPIDYIASGSSLSNTPPGLREAIIMWHGGEYSLGALYSLKAGLEALAEGRSLQLHIVSGQKPERMEKWGDLIVRFVPWSVEALKQTASKARLGIVPAREGARLSYLKPASRVRCMYALGVPTIGDTRVPDAVQFAMRFNGPLASSKQEWMVCIDDLLDSPERLDQIATAGHNEVAKHFSTANTARRWVRLLGELN